MLSPLRYIHSCVVSPTLYPLLCCLRYSTSTPMLSPLLYIYSCAMLSPLLYIYSCAMLSPLLYIYSCSMLSPLLYIHSYVVSPTLYLLLFYVVSPILHPLLCCLPYSTSTPIYRMDLFDSSLHTESAVRCLPTLWLLARETRDSPRGQLLSLKVLLESACKVVFIPSRFSVRNAIWPS